MKKRTTQDIYTWIHTSFSATSMTFFLALLSAGRDTVGATSITFASIFFCASLFLNVIMLFWLVIFGQSGELFNRVYPLSPWDKWYSIPSIAIFSFIFGLLSFLSFYSSFLAILAVLSIFIPYLILGNIYRKLEDEVVKKISNHLRE